MAGEDVGGNEEVLEIHRRQNMPKNVLCAVRGVFSGMFRLLMSYQLGCLSLGRSSPSPDLG